MAAKHVVVARRHGRNWFVGGMTADQAYRFHMPLSFLGDGVYIAHIYADPTDASASYEALKQTTRRVRSTNALDLEMRVAGGVAVVRIRSKDAVQLWRQSTLFCKLLVPGGGLEPPRPVKVCGF